MDEKDHKDAAHDEQELKVIGYCESIGYGRVMQIASEAWKEKCVVSAMVVGPCAGLTEPCGCVEPSKCDWCCGSMWLTKRVKKVKDTFDIKQIKLTTHEAANFLNMSRVTLIKILDSGEIPYTRVGTVRKVDFKDVLEYKEKLITKRDQTLLELSALDQEMGLA